MIISRVRYSTFLAVSFVGLFLSMLNLTFWAGEGTTSFSGLWGASKAAMRLLFIVLGIWYIFFRYRVTFAYLSPVFMLSIFFLMAFFSIYYSGDLWLSSLRLFEHVGIFIGVAALWLSLDQDNRSGNMVSLIAVSCFLLVLVVWAFLLVDPILATRKLGELGLVLGGEVLHSHTLGHASVLTTLIIFYRWNTLSKNILTRVIKILVIALLLTTIALTQSRSTLIILICGCVYILSLKTSARGIFAKYRRLFLILAAMALVILIFPLFVEAMLRGETVSEIQNFGNRSSHWAAVAKNVFRDAPLFGYGYQMLSPTGYEFELVPGVRRGMAHNAYIQTLGGLGIVGFLLIVAQSGLTYANVILQPKKLVATSDLGSRREFVIISLVCFLSSIVEFGMVGPTNPSVPIYMAIIVYAAGLSFPKKP